MTMAESENANTIIRNRTQLKPLVGKRFSFMGYLCFFNKNKYGDVENYPYVALLIDIFSFQYKVNLEHVHVQLTEADYEAIKDRNNLFLVFTGTVFTYEARVKRFFKNKYNQTEYRVLREPRFGFEDVAIEHVNMNEKLDQLNAEFSSILTTYETYAVGQIVTELTKVGIHPVSKKIIMTRLTEEKSVLKRDKMLRRLQMKLTYEKVVQQDVPELFYVRPALLNATDFDNVIEESKQKQHNLKIDSELRILRDLHKDLEGQYKDLQKQNQKLQRNLKQANVRTEKVKHSYQKTINQYKSVLADNDLKLWKFLQVYFEYRYLQFKNLFKKVETKKQSQEKSLEHATISAEDLQRLKDKLEN